jgi:putative oxidoreductase
MGSIALIFGFMGRLAAFGNIIIFSGALITHLLDGWFMNCFNDKKGEGIEYFIMLLALLFIVLINGSGAYSLDLNLGLYLHF